MIDNSVPSRDKRFLVLVLFKPTMENTLHQGIKMCNKHNRELSFDYFSNVLRSHKDICVLSQNQLSSDKLFLFTSQLAVVTACMFTMERFIEFCF